MPPFSIDSYISSHAPRLTIRLKSEMKPYAPPRLNARKPYAIVAHSFMKMSLSSGTETTAMHKKGCMQEIWARKVD